ncbi:MAG: insulinase family protein [Bacteroidia bacterium]|nr:insulinase family protein [Bacteroidia bacterium]
MWRVILGGGMSFLMAQPQLIYKDTLRDVYVYHLQNGLTVVVSPNTATPRAFVMIATRAGSKQDPPHNTGLAHYLEHMLFKGTDRYGTKDYDREKPYLDLIEDLYEKYNRSRDSIERIRLYRQIDSVSQLAAAWAIPNEYDRMVSALGAEGTNAFTSFEVTAYINDVPARNVEQLLRLEAERFRKPVLRLFHTELEAVYEEKNISIDNEYRELSEKILAALFPDHPYGTQTTIGTIEHLKNPSITAIKKYYETYYVPNNMVVIVAGDVESERVARWVDMYFGGFVPRPIPPFPYGKGGASPLKKRTVVTVVGPEAPQVQLAFRMPPAGTREAQILRILDQVLSNSVAGLLDEWLVQSRQVKSAGSSVLLLSDHSVHYLYAEPKPHQQLEAVEELLWQAIKRIQKGDFDEALIEAAVNDLAFSEMKSWRENNRRAQRLLDIFVKQRPWGEALAELETLKKIKKADIVSFARKYYPKRRCVVAYKRQGERPPLPKVPKPPITPLSIERSQSSSFAEAFFSESGENPLPSPQFIDFDTVFQRGSLYGKVPFYAIPNAEDSLFTLIWYLPLGTRHDKWLPLLFRYYEQVGPAGMGETIFKRRLFGLGARLRFSAGEEESFVILEGLVENLASAVRLVDSLLRVPAVDENAWAFIRENTLKSRSDAKRSPGAIQSMLTSYALYGESHPRKYIPTEGELRLMTAQELARRSADLWQYPWELYYDGPGGVSQASVIEKAMISPAPWQSPPAPKLFSMQETPGKQVYFVHFPMVRALLMWVHRSVPYRPELYPPARCFTEYFGGGMSAVVFQQIREAKGLAYAAWAYFDTPTRPDQHYSFLGYVSTQADKVIEAYQAMEELIDSLRIEPSLVEVAVQSLQAQLATERLRHERIFFSYWAARRLGQRRELRSALWEALPSLSAAQLEKFYREYLQGKPRTLLIIGDRQRIPLDKFRERGLRVEEVSLEALFGY